MVEISMEEAVIIGLSGVMAMLVFLVFMTYESIKEIRALRKLLKRDLQDHQEWLFHQLYSMAPGKVLKPDEKEEKLESRPAKVIHMNRDPMGEFTGKLDDWR